MSVIFANRPLAERIPIVAGSNKPLYNDTINIPGRGIYQADLPSRKLYGSGIPSGLSVLPIVNVIPFTPVTEITKAAQFAIDFYEGKSLYERRKAFVDNLSKGSTNTAPTVSTPVTGISHAAGTVPSATPDVNTMAPLRSPVSLGSQRPPSMPRVEAVVQEVSMNSMPSTATDGSTNDTPAIDAPMDGVSHQDVPPNLRSPNSIPLLPARLRNNRALQVTIPNYAAPNLPRFSEPELGSPRTQNTEIAQFVRDNPDAASIQNGMFFPEAAYDRRPPSTQLPPSLTRQFDQPNGWRAEMETSRDADDAMARLNVSLQNMTLSNPPAPAPDMQIGIAPVSNLARNRANVSMPGGFPRSPTPSIAPNLSASPQATEYHLGTPFHQRPASRENSPNGMHNYIPSPTTPVQAPSMSPIGSMDGPPAQDPMVMLERGNAGRQGESSVPPFLRRSTRVTQPPAVLTYDAGFSQTERRATASQPTPGRRGRRAAAAAPVPAPVDVAPEEPRRGTRTRRPPNRLTYDANGNQIG